MDFKEFELFMTSKGFSSLAEIARYLNTTPQAVSNWKSRNQIPLHVLSSLNINFIYDKETKNKFSNSFVNQSSSLTPFEAKFDDISFSDILLTISQQIKVIFLVLFSSVFLSFTYVQFIKQPLYKSSASILIPDDKNKASSLGSLTGLASQFGIEVPAGSLADLSSPSLFPELIKSRVFYEKILVKEFYDDEQEKKLSLIEILTNVNPKLAENMPELISKASKSLNEMISLNSDPKSAFSILTVEAKSPPFARDLARVIIEELELLNRFFKSRTVSEKGKFIENRIKSVSSDLERSEQDLKTFNEKNRQISTPALLLEQEKLSREVEIQKSIFLTLKQQFELVKIEEIQETTIVQVLDEPQLALSASNKNVKLTLLLSTVIGVFLGLITALSRGLIINASPYQRKKINDIKKSVSKKTREIYSDYRITGVVTILLLSFFPFYLSYESNNPEYFGRYSTKLFTFIVMYSSFSFLAIILTVINKIKSRK